MSAVYEFCVARSSAGAETWYAAEDLGITSIALERVHGGVDKLILQCGGQNILTDDAIFSFNAIVRMRRVEGGSAAYMFLGRMQPFARRAAGFGAAGTAVINGIWDWFEKTVMRQDWTDGANVTASAPRAVLFWSPAGPVSTGAQIERCIAVARAGGCPCAEPAEGDIAAGFTPPSDEQSNISVAQAVQTCLSYHPHSVAWVDYSEREPRVRVAARQSLPSFTVPLAAAQSEAVAITSREDLIPPAVAIAYQKPWSTGERCGMSTVIDHAPVVPGETDAERAARLSQSDVLWATYDLAGMQAVYAEKAQSLKTEAIDWNANKASWSWWARWCPQLNAANITDVGIMNPSTNAALPKLLLAGAVQEWMGVEEAEATFTCDAQIVTGPLVLPAEIRVEKLVVKLKVTDGATKTYKKKELTSYDSGESIPSGLAALLMAEWQQLHYDGEITLAAHDAPVGVGPGMTLNITGGRAEWAAMQAMIVSVAQDLGNGRTTIRFGVPQWIDIDSRVAFYRSCRSRRYTMTRNLSEPQEQGEVEQTDGGDAGIVGLPGSRDGGNVECLIRKVFFNPVAPVPHSVEIDLTDGLTGIAFEDPDDAAIARNIRLKEVLLPVKSGLGDVAVFKKSQILACAPYGADVPIRVDPFPGEGLPVQIIPEPPEPIEVTYTEWIGGEPLIDLNSADVQGAPVRIRVVLPGDGNVTPYPCKFIAARFPDKGDEDDSLGIVRGLATDQTHPLKARLAGVDDIPESSTAQRVYGYASPGEWGLFELESLFKYDAPNKRFYIDLAGYTNFKSLTGDSDTWDFNSDANLAGKNGATFDVVTDVSWDSTNNKLVIKKRSITIFKFGLKSIAAAAPTTVVEGEEC